MEHVNEVRLIGVVADKKSMATSTGKVVTKFTIVTTMNGRTGYHKVEAWERVSQSCDSLRDGDEAEVKGELKYNRWRDSKTGESKNSTTVNAYFVRAVLAGAGKHREVAANDNVPF